MTPAPLRAPFPWFGGKSRAAHIIWPRLGAVPNYVEPFAGSLAVLLARPHPPRTETVNDRDCYLSNFWRAVHADPLGVADEANWPVNEADLHARHLWLVRQSDFRERMLNDPYFYDSHIAGWWVWGLCQWIGSGWCKEPDNDVDVAEGVHQKRPRLARGERGVKCQIPDLSGSAGACGRVIHASGVSRKMPNCDGRGGKGLTARTLPPAAEWFTTLQARLRHVRVCCGDWTRVLGPAPTTGIGMTGVLLDPPYGKEANRQTNLYSHDDLSVAGDVRRWALEHGDNPKLRIALCGYEGEHEMPSDWEYVAWKAHGGYAGQGGKGQVNSRRERIWFSPACLKPEQQGVLEFDLSEVTA